MFKKFFRSWAKASESKRRAQYLESLEKFANREEIQQADYLVELVGLLAMAKQEFDQCESLHQFGEKQETDFDPLGEAVCDQAQAKILELARLHDALPPVFAKCEAAKLVAHLDKQRECVQAVHVAFAALKRASADKSVQETESLSESYAPGSALGQAIDALLLEVRTIERIRELG